MAWTPVTATTENWSGIYDLIAESLAPLLTEGGQAIEIEHSATVWTPVPLAA